MTMADDIVDGIFCDGCGVLLDGEASGFPRSCGQCGGTNREFNPSKNIPCTECSRRFINDAAMKQHRRARHAGWAELEGSLAGKRWI